MFFVGCEQSKPTHTIRFYPETVTTGNAFSRTVTMPESKIDFVVTRQPVIWEAHVEGVDLVKVASGHLALRFQFDDYGMRELYRQSVAKMGRRMITEINGKPMGVRQFDGALADGVYFTFMEMDEEELTELTGKLKDNIEIIKELKGKGLLGRG